MKKCWNCTRCDLKETEKKINPDHHDTVTMILDIVNFILHYCIWQYYIISGSIALNKESAKLKTCVLAQNWLKESKTSRKPSEESETSMSNIIPFASLHLPVVPQITLGAAEFCRILERGTGKAEGNKDWKATALSTSFFQKIKDKHLWVQISHTLLVPYCWFLYFSISEEYI